MTETLLSYRSLKLRLWYTRWRHEGDESPEEDAILDEMEQAWLKLSDEDRSLLTAEGPRCWPMDPFCWPPSLPLNDPRRRRGLMDSSHSDAIATELHLWFQSVLDLADQGLFGIVPEGPHRGAVILDILTRNARVISDAELDADGKLYTPVSLVLAAGSRKLSVSLRVGHWRAAVENVLQLRARMSSIADSAAVALDLGSPAVLFLHELKEALRQSGVTGVPSYLDDENRRIALGLALNWGMRLLLAYALECRAPTEASERKDLAWIATVLSATNPSPA